MDESLFCVKSRLHRVTISQRTAEIAQADPKVALGEYVTGLHVRQVSGAFECLLQKLCGTIRLGVSHGRGKQFEVLKELSLYLDIVRLCLGLCPSNAQQLHSHFKSQVRICLDQSGDYRS